MPVLSIYQPQRPVAQRDYADCLGRSGTSEDIDLLKIAMRLNHPVLVSQDGEHVIAKRAETGDEEHTFEALFDVCHTIADLRKMEEAKVDDPAKIPPKTYQMTLHIPIRIAAIVELATLAKNPGDCRRIVRALFKEDMVFREELAQHLQEIIADVLAENSDLDVLIDQTFETALKPPLDAAAGQTWRIVRT